MTEEILKLGTSAAIILVLLWVIRKSELREQAKDQRIQYLEHQLTESYDERIASADRIAEAMHSTRGAVESLTSEVRVALKLVEGLR